MPCYLLSKPAASSRSLRITIALQTSILILWIYFYRNDIGLPIFCSFVIFLLQNKKCACIRDLKLHLYHKFAHFWKFSYQKYTSGHVLQNSLKCFLYYGIHHIPSTWKRFLILFSDSCTSEARGSHHLYMVEEWLWSTCVLGQMWSRFPDASGKKEKNWTLAGN